MEDTTSAVPINSMTDEEIRQELAENGVTLHHKSGTKKLASTLAEVRTNEYKEDSKKEAMHDKEDDKKKKDMMKAGYHKEDKAESEEDAFDLMVDSEPDETYELSNYPEVELDDSLDEAEESDLKERSWNKDVQ